MVIMCVDDEVTVLNSLREELKLGLGDRFALEISDNAEDALVYLQESMQDNTHEIAIVISDHLMPGMKGDEFLIKVNKINPRIRKILLTGQASADAVGNAVNHANLYRYMAKPWDSKDLQMTIEEAAKSYVLDKELDARVNMLADLNLCGQILAEEVNINSSLERIILLATSKTASKKGVILLFDHNMLRYAVQAYYPEGELDLKYLDQSELVENLPAPVLTYANDTQEPLILPNAYRDDTWRLDSYVHTHRTRGVYVHRIENSGGNVMAVLYLESDRKDHFDALKQEFLDLFSRHAAATLANSNLYQKLEAKVAERTSELEDKNRSITDSIEYARRIQYSILPAEDVIGQHLPQHEILYEAKDIVCGDFYWVNKKKGRILVAAVDCTGHGVPGAFMTVMAYNLLNQIVNEQEIVNPRLILAELDLSVRKGLRQDETGGHDGMDIALVSIDAETGLMDFAGAYRPLYHLRNGQLNELKGDRQPIGGSLIAHSSFTNQTLKLERGDRVFLFSDGITDQIGGPERRKFSSKRFSDVLLSNSHLSLNEQFQAMKSSFTAWKNEARTENSDDIMVFAFEW